jgi:hypothetical protein
MTVQEVIPVSETARFTHQSFAVSFETTLKTESFAETLRPIFGEAYNSPDILPIPDEFGAEAPRLLFSSRHGFSQVVVSRLTASLNIGYSADFQTDASARDAYVRERIPLVFDAAAALSGGRLLFCGLTSRILMRVPTDSDEEVITKICEATLTVKHSAIFDIAVKRTYALRSRFFANVSVQNYRGWSGPPSESPIPRMAAKLAQERGVELLLDVNDRYAFNEDATYATSREAASEILLLTDEIADRETSYFPGGHDEE